MDQNNHDLHTSGSQAYPDRPLRMQKKGSDLPSDAGHDAYPDLPGSFRSVSSSWDPFAQIAEPAQAADNNPYSSFYHSRLKNSAPDAQAPVSWSEPFKKEQMPQAVSPAKKLAPDPVRQVVSEHAVRREENVPAQKTSSPSDVSPVSLKQSESGTAQPPHETKEAVTPKASPKNAASVRSGHDDLKLPPMTRVVTPVQVSPKVPDTDFDDDYSYGDPEPAYQASASLSNPVVRTMPREHADQAIRAAAAASSARQTLSSGSGKKRRNTQKTKRNNTLLNLLFLFFIFVFLFSVIMLLLNLLPRMRARSEYIDLTPEKLAKSGTVTLEEDDALKEASDSIAPAITQEMLDYYASINPDFIGWLDIPGTNIHYPMVKGDSNDYYLHHTFKDAYSDYGAIFMDVNNAADFTDDNSVIYGHNMRSGAMFHDLNTMKADVDYAREHMYYTITTPDGTVYTYQIFSIYRVSVDTDYRTPNIGNDADRIEYFYRLQGYSSLNLDRVSFRANDRIVTFSTCPPDSADDYRVAVHALLIKTEHI